MQVPKSTTTDRNVLKLLIDIIECMHVHPCIFIGNGSITYSIKYKSTNIPIKTQHSTPKQ